MSKKVKEQKRFVERNVERELKFKLTESEFAEKGKQAAEASKKLAELEFEFEMVKRKWKGQIEGQTEIVHSILSVIHAGEEKRHVDCTERKDFEKFVVEYIYRGEIMENRPMQMHERQLEILAPVKTNDDQINKEKAGVGNNGGESIESGERGVIDVSDIRSVMNEETNRKSKVDIAGK